MHLAPGHLGAQFDDRLFARHRICSPRVLQTRVKRGAELASDPCLAPMVGEDAAQDGRAEHYGTCIKLFSVPTIFVPIYA